MPSYKTLYTKAQDRTTKLTDLLINSSEKMNTLIDELSGLRAANTQLEERLSKVTTELADVKVKLAEHAINSRPAKATGTKAA